MEPRRRPLPRITAAPSPRESIQPRASHRRPRRRRSTIRQRARPRRSRAMGHRSLDRPPPVDRVDRADRRRRRRCRAQPQRRVARRRRDRRPRPARRSLRSTQLPHPPRAPPHGRRRHRPRSRPRPRPRSRRPNQRRHPRPRPRRRPRRPRARSSATSCRSSVRDVGAGPAAVRTPRGRAPPTPRPALLRRDDPRAGPANLPCSRTRTRTHGLVALGAAGGRAGRPDRAGSCVGGCTDHDPDRAGHRRRGDGRHTSRVLHQR